MMDTALFLFGLKMHRQEGHVKFYDADFLNTMQVSSPLFQNRTLGDCCSIVNEALSSSGFSGNLFDVGQLREIDDFDLRSAMIGSNSRMKISLRFNSFREALDAHLALRNFYLTTASGQAAKITCSFIDPAPRYFDGKFSTKFEACLRDKFTDLQSVNEVRSDYVKRGLLNHGL